MNPAVQQINLSDGWTGVVYHEWNFSGEVIEMWNSLAAEYGDNGIFLSYGWFENWWKAFNKTRSLFVVVLFKDGTARAIFPCCLNTSIDNVRKREEISSLTNDHTCHYDFLIDTGCRHQAISHVEKILRMIHPDVEMYFEYTPSKSGNVSEFIEELRRNNMPLHRNDGIWAPWIEVSGDWDLFFSALPGRFWNTLKRSRKKAEEKGELRFEVIRQSQRLDEILDALFEIEYRSWKGKEGTAIKSDPEVEYFYRCLAHWAMGENCLFLFLLKLDGLPVAGSFCLSSGKTVFLLKTGYDESFGAFSPGSLLQAEILKYLFMASETSVYNFLGACEPWKIKWTQNSSEYSSVRVYPRSLRGWKDYNVKYGWKTFLKRFDAARQLKSWFDKGK